ncbi:MAG: hypothetical protein ACFE8N_04905, partial [Promethearchaeota archaeon]
NETLKIDNFTNLDQIRIFDKMNIKGNHLPNSDFNFFYGKESYSKNLKHLKLEFRDIKFLPISLDFYNLINDLKHTSNLLDYFTSSSWRILWKNNEFEVFRLSESGMTEWVQKSRKRRISGYNS